MQKKFGKLSLHRESLQNLTVANRGQARGEGTIANTFYPSCSATCTCFTACATCNTMCFTQYADCI